MLLSLFIDSNEGAVGTLPSQCRGRMNLLINLPSNGSHKVDSHTAPTLSVPLVLPENPGECREVHTTARDHVIRTKLVHFSTIFVKFSM